MAPSKKTAKEIVRALKATDESELPDGFVPLGMSRVDGWFTVKTGNSIQGVIEDSFETKGKFGTRRVYKIKLTAGETDITDSEGKEDSATEGQMVGVDEKGWLKSLEKVEKGREVFIKCKGKGQATKGHNAPWIFALGVVPF